MFRVLEQNPPKQGLKLNEKQKRNQEAYKF